MRIAICDDSVYDRKLIEDSLYNLLGRLDTSIDSFCSGEELLKYLKSCEYQYTVIFMDIEMNGMDGFETVKKIREYDRDVYIIFLTSHQEYSLKGYEVSAYRYLLKPVELQKLQEAIESINAVMASQKVLFVNTLAYEGAIRLNDIIYLEASDQNVEIQLIDQRITVRYNLNNYEKELAEKGFYRIHRGYLVNFKHIKHYSRGQVELSNGQWLNVSRLRQKDFRQKFYAYIREEAR